MCNAILRSGADTYLEQSVEDVRSEPAPLLPWECAGVKFDDGVPGREVHPAIGDQGVAVEDFKYPAFIQARR